MKLWSRLRKKVEPNGRVALPRQESDVRVGLLTMLDALDAQTARVEARAGHSPTEGEDRPTRVLIVESNAAFRSRFRDAVRAVLAGAEIETATYGREALGRLSEGAYDAVILDLSIPGDLDGITLMKEIRHATLRPTVPVLVVSDELQDDLLDRFAVAAGATAVAEKSMAAEIIPAFIKAHVA